MRRRTTHPANYAREPRHAPHAKSTWPGAPSAPCALETRGTHGSKRARVTRCPAHFVTPPMVATVRVNAQLPPLVLARKVPREATGDSEPRSSEPRYRRGRTPQKRRASRELTLERNSRRGSRGGRAPCRLAGQSTGTTGHRSRVRYGCSQHRATPVKDAEEPGVLRDNKVTRATSHCRTSGTRTAV